MDDSAKWAMVPVEPTPEMCAAATEIDVDTIVSAPTRLNWEEAAAIYAAMLAAVPPPPAGSDGWRDIGSAPTWEDDELVLVCGGRFEKAQIIRSDGEYWRAEGLVTVKPKFWQPAPIPPVAPRG